MSTIVNQTNFNTPKIIKAILGKRRIDGNTVPYATQPDQSER